MCNNCNSLTATDIIKQITDNRKPYIESKLDNYIIRKFSSEYPEHLFKWHIDLEDRDIHVINDNNWKFQFDNQLPFLLEKNMKFFIKKNEYHRLIKGSGELILKIIKYNE